MRFYYPKMSKMTHGLSLSVLIALKVFVAFFLFEG